jgi:phosphoglycolate phosphatase
LTIKHPFKAIVFDFDGTLAKLNIDFLHMRRAVLDAIAGYGVPTDDLKHLFVLEMIDAGRKRISAKHILSEEEYYRKAHALISRIEIEAAKDGNLFEGTKGLLLELGKRNVKTAVVTRNCYAALAEVFPDINEYLDVIMTRDRTKYVKPHPDHLRLTLSALGVPPKDAAMVGDHPMDIKIGKDTGTWTIGVLTGYSKAEELKQVGADVILDEAADVMGILS